MDVRLPDGRILRNVPEGTTRAQIEARLGGAQPTERQMLAQQEAVDVRTMGHPTQQNYQRLDDQHRAWQENRNREIRGGADPGPSTLLGAAQGFGRPLFNTAARLGIPGAQSAVQSMDEGIAQREKAGQTPGTGGKILGNVAVTAPIALATTNPYAVGAAGGALLSEKETPLGVLADTGIGAALGRAGDAVVGGIGRAISPVMDRARQTLSDAAVRMTPGQIFGGWAKRAEDKLTSLPLVGDMITGAQRRSVEDFNRAAINRSLAPINAQLARDVPAGHQAVDLAHQELSNAYDAVVPTLNISIDPQFQAGVQALITAGQQLPGPQAAQFANTLRDQLGRLVRQQTPDVFREVSSKIKSLARQYAKSENPDHHLLAEAFQDTQTELSNLLARTNPAQAAQLRAIDEGWANLVRVEKAATSAGTRGGVFSPAQFQGAVRQGGTRSQVATGNALGQDLSSAANEVLPSQYPDSGSIGRLLINAGVLGGGGAAVDRGYVDARTAALVAALMGVYSRPGIATINAVSQPRGAAAQALAQALQDFRPLGALGTSAAGSALLTGR